MTLQKVEVITVDEQGNTIKFLDRRQKQNKDKPMIKKLLIQHFGFYMNTMADKFVMDQPI
jgi:hypothetical protein